MHTGLLQAQTKADCQQRNSGNASVNQLSTIADELKNKAEDKAMEEEMIARLQKLGHRIFPIQNLSMIVKSGSPISYSDLSSHHCKALLSGTFYGGKFASVGPYMKDSVLSTPESKTIPRGYVGVLSDGHVVISSMSDTKYNYHDAHDRKKAHSMFEDHLKKIENNKHQKFEQLLGGGALLIRTNDKGEGQAVGPKELESQQYFDQGIGNLVGAQMRRTHHAVVFIHNGKPYAMLTASVNGKTIQNHLIGVQAQSAVKFDGGSGCALFIEGDARNACPARGANPSGLCVK